MRFSTKKPSPPLAPLPRESHRRGTAARWGAALLFAALLPFLPARATSAPATMVEDSGRAARPRQSGLIDEVLVTQGQIVKAGQIVARLDSIEVDHQIESLSYKIAIANEDIDSVLRAAARGLTDQLEDRRQMLLKRRSLESDLRYLQTLRQSLDIRAPVAGRIATRDPQALVGRRAEAGASLLQIEPTRTDRES